MNKYLVSAAIAAVVAVGAFAAPASAQSVGLSINAGGGHDRYYDGGHRYGHGYRAPGVRVYTGRNAYRADDCYTKRVVKWRNGQKIVRETRVCN